MITATTKEHGTVKVHGLCNRGETLGTPWLILIGCGSSSFHYVAIACNPQDALDIYADSKYGHMTRLEKAPPPEEEDWYCQLGNCGDWHDLSNTTRDSIVSCSVNYFAKPVIA